MIWGVWLREEWNTPDRTDHYLIQVAQEVRRSYVKRPARVKFEHLKLKFTLTDSKGGPPEGMTKERAAALSKARWLGRMTMPVRVVTAPRPDGMESAGGHAGDRTMFDGAGPGD